MRLSALSVICFFVCTVLAAPLPGPPAKAPAKPAPAGKPVAGKPTTSTKPTTASKTCSGKAKRAPSPVKDAWLSKGEFVGGGAKGHVYDLPNGFNGPAVIKEIQAPWDSNAASEVSNLIAVDQFIAWGKAADVQVQEGEPAHTKPISAVYIVMKKMGVNLAKSKLTPAEATALEAEAKTRYMTRYHMANKDLATNGPNFVYQKVGGKWTAEIIDWDRADVQSTMAPPAAEVIDFYCMPGAFPKKRAVFNDLD